MCTLNKINVPPPHPPLPPYKYIHKNYGMKLKQKIILRCKNKNKNKS